MTTNEVITIACDLAGIAPAEFDAPCRRRENVLAKNLVSTFYAGRMTWQKIAALTGRKCHASAMHGVTMMHNALELRAEPETTMFREFIARLDGTVRGRVIHRGVKVEAGSLAATYRNDLLIVSRGDVEVYRGILPGMEIDGLKSILQSL
jgi:hypothetical protein